MIGAAASVESEHRKVAPAKAPTAPGSGDPRDDLPVDVAEPPVRGARRERRADLGEVDGGRGGGRGGAGGQEQRGRRDAVRHAEAAVDELGGEPDQRQKDEFSHCDPTSPTVPYEYDGRRNVRAGVPESPRRRPHGEMARRRSTVSAVSRARAADEWGVRCETVIETDPRQAVRRVLPGVREELEALVRIPSVSAPTPRQRGEVRRTAEATAAAVPGRGRARSRSSRSTGGQPAVLAQLPRTAGPADGPAVRPPRRPAHG